MITLIIAIVTAITLGSMSGSVDVLDDTLDAWEKGIKKIVKDDEREDKALARLEVMRTELKEETRQLGEAFLVYYTLDSRYDVTMAEYVPAIQKLGVAWTEMESWMLDGRFDMKAILTAEEWQEASKRVNEKTEDTQEDVDKGYKKLEEKLSEEIADYEEDYNTKYIKPVYIAID